MPRGSQLRKEGTSYDAHFECVVGRCASASAKKHVVLGLVPTALAALAIVPNGLGFEEDGATINQKLLESVIAMNAAAEKKGKKKKK